MNHSKETIMAQAQVFASSWSMVGGPFDRGNEIKNAEAMKLELATMIEAVFQQRDELLVALNDAVQIAKVAHEYWDSDQDSKVGKYLMALAGYLPGYSGLTDGVHKAIASAKGGA